ncbi:MAG: ABC transporter permease [Candidatus Aminicenantes bacterium]|nr:ABC transporter permease [Candidatus Aminicenantes bacterium]
MFFNHLLTAWRNLKKQKFYSFVNLLGMAVGIAGFGIFALTAGTKSHADRFHKKGDRICGVIQVVQYINTKEEKHTAFCPGPLTSALEREFPEIEDTVRVLPTAELTIARGKDTFFQKGILFVDPEFLNVFSFTMNSGFPETALDTPDSIVLNQSTAEKYFGNEDPIGRTLILEGNKELTVTGILTDIPRTSSLRFDALISLQTVHHRWDPADWDTNRYGSFLLLRKGADRTELQKKLSLFLENHIPNTDQSLKRMYLFPLKDFRLKGSHIETFMATSSPEAVFIGLFLGGLLLIIVSINFINLSTSRYMQRLKEIGIRKAVGAKRSNLFRQFVWESMFMAFCALPAAVLIYEIIHPLLSSFLGTSALSENISTISNSFFNYPFLWKYFIGAVCVTGLLSGLYPALFLSSFGTVQALKGRSGRKRKKRRGGKFLIVFQFSLSVLFIALAGIMKSQSKVFMQSDFGYHRERVASIQLPKEVRPKVDIIKTELLRHADIVSVSASGNLPLIWSSPENARPTGSTEDKTVRVQAYGIDYGFIETMKIDLLHGRSHQKSMNDETNFVINEEAARNLPWKDPLNKPLTVGDKKGIIIGVTKNFLFEDIGFKIPPAVLTIEPENLNFLLIKYAPGTRFEDLRLFLKEKWQLFAPDLPFACKTLEQFFDESFTILSKVSGIFRAFGLAAVLFSCLGLLGLVSVLLEQRVKEIGIRKVLGASVLRITWRTIREFMALVLLANVLSLVLIYIGWRQILKTGLLFITPLHAGVYFSAFLLTFLTAMTAVLYRTWRAAAADPVHSLRYE